MIAKKITTFFLCTLMALSLSGCGAVLLGGAAAGGTYAYVAGQAKRQYNANLSSTYQATLKACQGLGLKIESNEKRISDASIKAIDVDTTIYIDMKSISSRVTEVSVRYGMLGDEQASSRILSRIKSNL
ncbi:DUF3568 family protein [Maridesulfovibrio ferrireducens]|uniref:DUF3568 family protein n=1 Tax=Maridesulfovibrio ferrireducens TaxID=246191 RepID=A0A1G9H7F4_9BACT|nr:DUF3568 family protein [Maridesulfovibrio ferrireducens]MBI9110609.1 DUF3568 family protein [Maridesulfovibrio ferrireducens]SDL08948.1 Protein of unknown function [Maridesulfovibrio ferrireducens]